MEMSPLYRVQISMEIERFDIIFCEWEGFSDNIVNCNSMARPRKSIMLELGRLQYWLIDPKWESFPLWFHLISMDVWVGTVLLNDCCANTHVSVNLKIFKTRVVPFKDWHSNTKFRVPQSKMHQFYTFSWKWGNMVGHDSCIWLSGLSKLVKILMIPLEVPTLCNRKCQKQLGISKWREKLQSLSVEERGSAF